MGKTFQGKLTHRMDILFSEFDNVFKTRTLIKAFQQYFKEDIKFKPLTSSDKCSSVDSGLFLNHNILDLEIKYFRMCPLFFNKNNTFIVLVSIQI